MPDQPTQQHQEVEHEISFVPEETAALALHHSVPVCDRCRGYDDDRGFVIRFSGIVTTLTPLVIVILSYLDAINRKVAWQPDERILLAALAALGALWAFAWKTKKEE